MLRRGFRMFNFVQQQHAVSPERRRALLRRMGIACDPTATVLSGVLFGSDKARLGPGSFISHGCLIDGSDWVTVGRGVHLGPGVKVITGTHEIGPAECRAGRHRFAPVTIGDGAWIGTNAVLLPGITIGAGSVIAAGAVVLRSTDPNGLYAGMPAAKLKDIGGEAGER